MAEPPAADRRRRAHTLPPSFPSAKTVPFLVVERATFLLLVKENYSLFRHPVMLLLLKSAPLAPSSYRFSAQK